MSKDMKAEAFAHEIVGTSRTFYRSQDLQVVIEGDTAATDGNKVYIPAFDMSKGVPLKQQMITRGYIDHEAGHGRHTDMKEYQRVAPYQYAQPLANAMEDVRIESLIIEEYPGAQKNLEAVTEAVNGVYLKHAAKDPTITKDFKKVGAVALTWEGRLRLGYDSPSSQKCLDTLDPDVLARVKKIADVMMGLKSTKEVVDTAIALDKELKDEPGSGGGAAGAGGTHAGSGGPGKGGSGMKEGMYVPEAADAMSDLAKTEVSRGGGYRVWSWTQERWFEPGDKKSFSSRFRTYISSHGEGAYEKSKASISGVVGQCRRKFERALISKQNRGWIRNQEEGALDSRRLVAAMGGATSVHRQREPVDDIDASVLLVIDLSGSMHGEKIILARKSAITYAEALEKNGIPFAVAGFTCQYSKALNDKASTHESRYRNFPLDLYVFKEWDTPLKRARGGLGSITSEAVSMHDNADGDSLLQLYWRFLKDRKTKRRVMIVFSDGMPAAAGGNQDQRLRDVTNYIESEGVDLVGVGVLSDAPKRFYKKHTVVNKIEDLAKESLQQLAQLLIDPKFKVDNSELMGVTEKIRGK